jgi:glycosyltransferase involved in cell wall biosynthesis
MNIAWFTPEAPWPPTDGNRQRHLHLLRAAARRHRVRLVTSAPQEKGEAAERLTEMGVDVVVAAHTSQGRGRLTALASGMPGCFVPASIDAFAEPAGSSPDVAFGALYVAPAVMQSRARARIIDEQNVEADLYRSLARWERPGKRKVARLLDAAEVRRFERRWTARADLVTVISSADEARLRQLVPDIRTMQVVPNGVDTEEVAFAGPDGRDPTQLVLVGGMAYAPNVHAARFLVQDVLPQVWDRHPEVVLSLVGKDPAPEVRELAGERVVVTGEVPDVRPFLARAALTVIPLRSGGGSRLKVLEAMASGTPVVTTPTGAAGLDLRSGEEVVLASDAAGLAAAVVDLIEDPARAHAMARRARERVERDFTWNAIGARFVEALERVAAER